MVQHNPCNNTRTFNFYGLVYIVPLKCNVGLYTELRCRELESLRVPLHASANSASLRHGEGPRKAIFLHLSLVHKAILHLRRFTRK